MTLWGTLLGEEIGLVKETSVVLCCEFIYLFLIIEEIFYSLITS